MHFLGSGNAVMTRTKPQQGLYLISVDDKHYKYDHQDIIQK